MKRIELSLGEGWAITVFTGNEWGRFVKTARPFLNRYNTFNDVLDGEPSSVAVCDMVYVKEINNVATLVHELIHALTWVRNTLGMDDSPLQEWLAYSIGYCLVKLNANRINGKKKK